MINRYIDCNDDDYIDDKISPIPFTREERRKELGDMADLIDKATEIIIPVFLNKRTFDKLINNSMECKDETTEKCQ